MDTLECAAGVPPEKLVEAHCSFLGQSCISCHTEHPADRMKKRLLAGSVPQCETCVMLVEPNIVFFEGSLPREFHMGLGMVEEADLGELMERLPICCASRTGGGRGDPGFINKERAEGIGGRTDDVLLLGRCDLGVIRPEEELGRTGELEEVWRSVGGGGGKKAEVEEESSEDAEPVESMDAKVGRLTEDVERDPSVVDGWKDSVMQGLSTQERRLVRMVEVDLCGENGEVNLVDQNIACRGRG